MSFCRLLPLISVLIAFIGTVISSVLSRKKARYTAFCCEGLCFLCGVGVLVYALQNGDTVFQLGHLTVAGDGTPMVWLNNVLRFGVPEGLFAVAFPPILFCCILGSTHKLERDLKPNKEKFYYVLTNLVLVALLAMTYADDIFTCYVFLEISTLSSIGLIAAKDRGRTTVAAIRYMIFNLVGSGMYLIGIVLLYDLTGYFMPEKIHGMLAELAQTGENGPVIAGSLALITAGLGIKSGLFPFHFWMADAYGEATTASASIISGLVSKGYLLLLIKLMTRAFGMELAAQTGVPDILFVLGICGMIFGSVSAIFEKRINKMIAFSSAAQIGYVYMALGLGEVGIPGAMLQMLAHAVTKPLLFIAARGLIEVSDYRPQFRFLRGSGLRNRAAGAAFAFGAFSMIGFPITAGFTVKFIFIEIALTEGVPLLKLMFTVAALVISTFLNTGYFIHTFITLYSEPQETEKPHLPQTPHRNRIGSAVASGILGGMNLLLGLSPWVLTLVRTHPFAL